MRRYIPVERSISKKLNINDNIVFAVLAISGLNFMLEGVMILGVFAIIYIAINHSFVPTKAIIPVTVYGIVYAMSLVMVDGGINNIAKALLIPVVWLFGYIFMSGKSFGTLLKAMVFMAFGMAAHGVLNLIYNIMIGNDYSSGQAYDIFSRSVASATGQTTYFTMIVALAFWLIFIQKNVWLRISGAALYLISLYYDVSIGGRTFLVMSLFSLLFCSVVYLSVFFKDKASYKKGFVLIIFLILLYVFIIIAYNQNWFSIRNAFSSSYLNTRIQRGSNIINDQRFDRKAAYLKHMGEYLWGGHELSNTYDISYAHDIWLDTFDEAGILAFITLLLYTLFSIIRFIRVSLIKSVDITDRIVVFNYMIISLAQFFVEPILKSFPVLFFCYIMIDGMICAVLIHSKYTE